MSRERNHVVYKIAAAGLLAALSYVAFQFFKIPITLPGGSSTYFHLGNTFAALGGLLLGGFYGGLAAGVGLSIADLTSGLPLYAVSTIFLKLIIGLVTGLVGRRIGHINEKTDRKQIWIWSLIACAVGLGVNIIADPVVGYFRNCLMGLNPDLSSIVAKLTAGVTFVNAVLSCVISVILYNVLRPALKKEGIFDILSK